MLIAISGKIESGKDLFSELLHLAIYCSKPYNKMPQLSIEDLNDTVLRNMVKQASGFKIVKFADALKDIVCRLIGCTREQLEDQDFKNSVMAEEWWERKGNIAKRMRPTFQGVIIDADEIRKPTYREFLQELGTNVLRNWIPNIHVNATFASYKPVPVPIAEAKVSGWGKKPGELEIQKEKYPDWIITDMRFPNELVAVKERGGIVIRINRDTSELLKERKLKPEHESETALDDYQFWDVVIDNNGTIEQLYEQAIKIVKQFKLT